MATVLLTWELGLGIGHLMNLRPIACELLGRGHRVFAALRDLSRAREVFGETSVTLLQAPYAVPKGKIAVEKPQGWVHLLANNGFSSERVLEILIQKWTAIFDRLNPDLVIADHSPTVLLALRGTHIPHVNIGLGFFCPPDIFPLPFWSPLGELERIRDQVSEDENLLLVKANRILAAHRRPLLDRFGQLFNEIQGVFLATYREFDHFGPRGYVRYWGHWPFGIGETPTWPTGSGPKIYSYLNPSPELEPLLKALSSMGYPTLVLSAGIDSSIRARYAGPSLHFVNRPLDLRAVGAQCDVAITNAGHGTVATLLLAGKPCLLVALSMEQLLFARTVEHLGAGRIASDDPRVLELQIMEVIHVCAYAERAKRFAKSYARFRPGEQVSELVDHLSRFLR
jgi:UDP:flavonoid glycosyltransferase YjiC (YdhE family)